jgi:serine/threonine protein kinase/WD40 repeat protein
MLECAKDEKAIFLAALEQTNPAERQNYLQGACGDNAALLKRLRVLLSVHEQSQGPLDAPSPGLAIAATIDGPITERPGTIIGSYKLMEQIGEGGMGLVFVAEQQQPVRRKVALKVIKPGMDTRQVIARFEAERQALALMDHPNIAKVLDAGETASGRPYFVMELVKGAPITEYCDHNQLAVRERLNLFLDVCQAVQHAHQKGIIHRDIKPSNVLVVSNDGAPLVKVIDFGVAKAIGQQLTDKTIYTQFTQLIGTPLYMSPEQAGQSGVDVDTRTDIYALGVLLYELLTGTTPFGMERLSKASYEELRRIIREEEPPKPSTRISTLGQAATTISAHRKSEPRRLSELVRGDLDWIVMKALDKDRNRRYETASAFAADVGRYLKDEPVHACPPSVAYRLRKFAKRNNRSLLVAAGIIFLLIAGIVGTTVGLVRAIVAEGAEQELRTGERRTAAASFLAQARAHRWSRQVGQRFNSLDELAKAARLQPSLELRNEVVACLALADLRPARSWAGHPPGTTAVVFDANLEHYARSNARGEISVRRVSDDVELASLPGPGAHAYYLKYSPDGRYLAALYHRSSDLRVWDLEGRRLAFHTEIYGAMDFSPDSSRIALFSSPTGGIRIYDLASGALEQRFDSPRGGHCFAFDPTGRWLAVTRDADGHGPAPAQVEIYDLGAGKLRHALPTGSGPGAMAWAADSATLAVSNWDRNDAPIVSVLDVQSGARLAELRGSDRLISTLAYNRQGDLLAATGWDQALRLWDPRTGRLLLSQDGAGGSLQFSRNHHFLTATTSGTHLEMWDVTSGSEACRVLACPTFGRASGMIVCFSPDGRILASASSEGAELWDWRASRSIAQLGIGRTDGVAFHPADGRLLTWGRGSVHAWPYAFDAESAQGWRLGPPAPLGAPGLNGQVCLSPDGRKLARAYADLGRVIVSDLEAGNDRLVLEPHDKVTNVALSPDGRWAATSAFGGEAIGQGVRIWDLHAGKLVLELPLDIVTNDTAVAFSPDNRWLVTGTDREYRLWQVDSWSSERAFRRDHGGAYAPMAFTRDGRMLAICATSRLVRLIDVHTGLELVSLAASDERRVFSLCFSPDDTQLAVGCDGQIQIWDLRYVRRELSAMGLDWEATPYPPSSSSAPLPPGQLRVLLGGLIDPATHQPIAVLARKADYEAWDLATNLDPRLRDVSRAVQQAKKAVQWEPGTSFYWNTLGVALYRAGQWRDAIAALKKSEELEPGRSFSFNAFFLAMAHWQMGEKEQAKKLYDQAVQWMVKNKPKDQYLIRFRAEAAELLGINAKQD